MVAPFVTNFGDESHDFGETGLVIDGFEFGFWDGEVWMFANADRSGAADQLTFTAWGERQITGVAIPASPNNVAGTVYLAVKTQENEWSTPAFPYTFTLADPGVSTAVLSGPIASGITEVQLRSTSYTLTITLTGTTFVVASFDSVRQDLIDGITSDGSEPTGWNTVVRDNIPVGNVTRVDDTNAEVVIDAAPSYDVTADETITVTVPASIIDQATPIVATPTFAVTFVEVVEEEAAPSGAGGVGPARRPRSRRARRGQKKEPTKRSVSRPSDFEPDEPVVEKAAKRAKVAQTSASQVPVDGPDFQAMAAEMAAQAEQLQALGVALEDMELDEDSLALLLLLTI